ncbi:S-layer glycoprotein [Paenibacillus sp. 481]|uniref:S-layer glycoprotein n=1 Tax=Paenibacillus sp. 481 TaxID=2835869 RepID=UPI001E42AAE6|nr:S-layer glycoprotein [Paenibacillus sp. 481]UHA75693.1 S-layer homology domain-containing protein [Paenibacillus sp. 481]
MREMSYETSTQNSQQTKVFRGGEKKVMKKRLALLLSVAMAFSMFANVAFGAEAAKTTEEKFEALKKAGIVNGLDSKGTPGLDKNMTRAAFAKTVVKVFGLKEVTGVHTYKDKNYGPNHWAAPFVEAVTAENLMNGKDPQKKLFDLNGNITVQEVAKVIAVGLKLELPKGSENTASAWAKDYVAAVVKAGVFPESTNWKAVATRGQVFDAAYAAYNQLQGPKVDTYKVLDGGKTVEFTMSDKEVVAHKLEKALESNKETEVKFKVKSGKEYTHKVTYTVTAAQKVESVKAENLKQIVVTFDGTVDVKSAENKENYEVKDSKEIEKVTLSADKKVATILLKQDDKSSLVNQKETELKVKNVKNEDSSKTFDQTIKFTPIDAQIPTVKEVVGLGTKAFKVVFSEPVKPGSAHSSANYKVDGKTIGAQVNFVYPNVAIVITDVAVGEHKLTVSNIEDFSGLKTVPADTTFTVTEDTAAPEVSSAKTNDLKEVTIEFNETIRSIDKVYFNNTSNSGTYKIEDNKLKVTFSNTLSMGENNITIEGVTDYSGNKVNRDTKVTPTLDTERPTVLKVEAKTDANGKHYFQVDFSEKLKKDSAEKKENYVIKKDGKIVKSDAVNSTTGHPSLAPKYEDDKKRVNVYVGAKLDNGDYTLEISNVQDAAHVANTIFPVTQTVKVSETNKGSLHVWRQAVSDADHIYVQFPRNVRTDGDGSATATHKYVLIDGTNRVTLHKDAKVTLQNSSTVRIEAPKDSLLNKDGSFKFTALEVRGVSDFEDKYFANDAGYTMVVAGSDITDSVVALKEEPKATSKEEVKLVFKGQLGNINHRDFEVKVGSDTYVPNNARLVDGNTVYLQFTTSENKLPTGLVNATVVTTNSISSYDVFGNKIGAFNKQIVDEVQPEQKGLAVKSVSATTYEFYITTTEDIEIVSSVGEATLKQLFTVNADTVKGTGEKAEVTKVEAGTTANEIKITVVLPAAIKADAQINIKFEGTGGIEAIVDKAAKKNKLKNFGISSYFNNINVKN